MSRPCAPATCARASRPPAATSLSLEFTEEALKQVVQKAKKRKTGARALRSIIEQIMLPVMFEAPDKANLSKILVSEEGVELVFNDSKKERKTA